MPRESQSTAHLDSCILYWQSDFLSKENNIGNFFKSKIPRIQTGFIMYAASKRRLRSFKLIL